MGSLGLRSIHLSFLEAHYTYPEKIESKHYAWLNVPNSYYDKAIAGNLTGKQVFVPSVGQFRSALNPRHPFPQLEDAPYPDLVWGMLKESYDTTRTAVGKVPFYPFVPVMVDYLPSQRREYSMDITSLPGTLASAKQDLSKASISLYYFPIGYTITRVGLYLETGQSFDPADIVPLFRYPDRFCRTTVKKGERVLEADSLVAIASSVLRRFVSEICKPNEVALSVARRYSLVDFAEASEPARIVSPSEDGEVIFNLIKSSQIREQGKVPEPNIGEEGFDVAGDQRGFMWMQRELPIPAFRPLHRRKIRNLAMLILIQQAVAGKTTSLEDVNWNERVSKSLLRQWWDGIVPPSQFWPVSYLHCLHLHHPFATDINVNGLYKYLRKHIDPGDSIGTITNEFEERMKTVVGDLEQSRDKDDRLLAAAISRA